MLEVGLFKVAIPRKAIPRMLYAVLQEYAELPVRHNEDVLNGELSKKLPWPVGTGELDSPHVKAHLLLQVHYASKNDRAASAPLNNSFFLKLF